MLRSRRCDGGLFVTELKEEHDVFVFVLLSVIGDMVSVLECDCECLGVECRDKGVVWAMMGECMMEVELFCRSWVWEGLSESVILWVILSREWMDGLCVCVIFRMSNWF